MYYLLLASGILITTVIKTDKFIEKLILIMAGVLIGEALTFIFIVNI